MHIRVVRLMGSLKDTTSLVMLQDELLELQDADLAQKVRELQQRAESTWQKYWVYIFSYRRILKTFNFAIAAMIW